MYNWSPGWWQSIRNLYASLTKSAKFLRRRQRTHGSGIAKLHLPREAFVGPNSYLVADLASQAFSRGEYGASGRLSYILEAVLTILTDTAAVVQQLVLVGLQHRQHLYDVAVVRREAFACAVEEDDDVSVRLSQCPRLCLRLGDGHGVGLGAVSKDRN
jgi:hypothetical protein